MGCSLRATILVVGLSLALECAAAASAPPQTWTISAARPCAGLSAIWTPPLAALKPLVGRWTPAGGPRKNHGVFVLFVTRCPQSAIDKAHTGTLTVGAVLIAIKPPAGIRGAAPVHGEHWAAVASVYAASASAVAKLFGGHGFPATAARLGFQVDHAHHRASFSIATATGRTHVSAAFTPDSARRANQTMMLGISDPPFGTINGPESSTRYGKGTGAVTADGDTWLARLGLPLKPAAVALDTNFRWQFVFRTNSGKRTP